MKTLRGLWALCATIFAATAATSLQASEPQGYYSSCEGKGGRALLQQVGSVVGSHHNVGYDGLWEVYETSDVRPDGTLWDIYSTKHWPRNFHRCGNYQAVGDCVNREHSMPKSWFDNGSPMNSDAYHLYPTDGKVNGQRSNYPYGECASGTTLPASGGIRALGRLGSSTFPGYSGIVFEPDDEYKGDLARGYFYMVAAYNGRVASWSSPMLAGNAYPAFTSWAVDLLLKWNRQDPVSQKEIDRNNAVSSYQNNRNPFIDHPEMAEYIWGTKKDQQWSLTATAEPELQLPVDGSTVDMGRASVGRERTVRVTVKGSGIAQGATATVGGTGFSLKAASLGADAVNGGTAWAEAAFTAAAPGTYAGSMTISASGATTTVTLTAQAVEGLPAGPAREVTDRSFRAVWTCIDPGHPSYTLDVRRADTPGASLAGYPAAVDGSAEQALVEDLEAETAYTYTVSNGTATSLPVAVTTGATLPSVSFLYDGPLPITLTADEQQPSAPAELLADIEGIPGDLRLSVATPFELSTDKASWARALTLAPGEDRFYLRIGAAPAATYNTVLLAEADGGFAYDDVEITGVVNPATPPFLEDFEPKAEASTYGETTYQGTACTWHTMGIYLQQGGSNAYPHSGQQAARTNKSGDRTLAMTQDKANGMGTMTVWGRLWSDDTEPATFAVEVSSDQGAHWSHAGTFTVTSNSYAPYTVAINRQGGLRLRLSQSAGARTMLDDLALTDHADSSALNAVEADYHSWDAFGRGGSIVIEVASGAAPQRLTVYTLDGATALPEASYAPGTHTIGGLPAGFYIVASDTFGRRLMLR